MKHIKLFENFQLNETETTDMVEMKKDEVYKIYDKVDGTLYKSAAKFDLYDKLKGNKFTLINLPLAPCIWIKQEDMDKYVFAKSNYVKK